jgi:hypothetical protein
MTESVSTSKVKLTWGSGTFENGLIDQTSVVVKTTGKGEIEGDVGGDIENVQVLEQSGHVIQTLLGASVGAQLSISIQTLQELRTT